MSENAGSGATPHPLDAMVEFLKVQLKAQEKRRQIEFALQQITTALINGSEHTLLVNGNFGKFNMFDGQVCMKILTAFLRGSSFEATQESVEDVIPAHYMNRVPQNSKNFEFNRAEFIEQRIRHQKEILFHLLGRAPRVTESTKGMVKETAHWDPLTRLHETIREERQVVVSAIFSYD